jgi:hypothetical protein
VVEIVDVEVVVVGRTGCSARCRRGGLGRLSWAASLRHMQRQEIEAMDSGACPQLPHRLDNLADVLPGGARVPARLAIVTE